MRKTSYDIAHGYFRDRILRGDYRPGAALVVNALSVESGFSGTTVREALRRLATEGLVTIEMGAGASVRRMRINELGELLEIRVALEVHAAGRAALMRTASELGVIHAALAAMRSAVELRAVGSENEPEFPARAVRHHARFHLAVLDAARNELLKQEILRLHLVSRVVAATGVELGDGTQISKSGWDARRGLLLAELHEVYQAIAAQSARDARSAMERHLRTIMEGRALGPPLEHEVVWASAGTEAKLSA